MIETRQGLVGQTQRLFIHQIKEWIEIALDWETSNKYEITSEKNERLGLIAERSGGFWTFLSRSFLRSHRPLQIDVFNTQGKVLFQFRRKFFFFFSDLLVQEVKSQGGRVREDVLGHVHRRFGILFKKYDLLDETGKLFAQVKAPIWRLWTFPLLDPVGQQRGQISKKWQGVLKEMFTDADRFLVDYGEHHWTLNQRTVILAAAISIDFDFFEENRGWD